MATTGILMAVIPWHLVAALFVIVACSLVAIDSLKVRAFRYFGVR